MALFDRLRGSDARGALVANRLTEPLHILAMSAVVAIFGTFRARVAFDLIFPPAYAYCILQTAELARALGLARVTIVEFGVANGAGLLAMCRIARSVTAATGVEFDIVGFDREGGMPPPVDYRDHPELWQAGDFVADHDRLRAKLPPNARLVVGDLAVTVPAFAQQLSAEAPLGFASLDVDYYSSASQALSIFEGRPEHYLPWTCLYADDIVYPSNNRWCGELLAIEEFNASHVARKIDQWRFLPAFRRIKNARWLGQVYFVHVLDHPRRQPGADRIGDSFFQHLYA
ncbi:MAG TPA: hypothetical protein VEJ41_03410 [Candidatus Acidoferrales bacterium]|nr:hypothetical protein [Candidatus Acidoferrales bacterium]